MSCSRHYPIASSSATNQPDKPKRRLRLRFGLRTFLIVMLLLGVVFGILGSMAYEARRQRQVVADLREASAFEIEFSDEQVWMPELLDTGYLGRVTYIRIVGKQFDDVSTLTEFENLEWLKLHTTPVSDLSPLASLENLKRLYLNNTPVSDLSPLAGLENLVWLELSFTPVSDVSPLAGLENLEQFTKIRAGHTRRVRRRPQCHRVLSGGVLLQRHRRFDGDFLVATSG